MSTATFYCACDTTNVVGVVGLLNSLRLQGHREDVVILDAGLAEADRALLDGHARLVPTVDNVSAYFRKYALPQGDAGVHIVIDADVILTRPLTNLIERARSGRMIAFADDLVDRFHPEWGELLRLGKLEPRPYVNAGLLIVPSQALHLLDAVLEHEASIEFSQTLNGGGPPDAPFLYNDQDILNALLASREAPELIVLEHRLAPHPPFSGLSTIDEHRLVCRYPDGAVPYALHHVLEKPWMAHTHTNIYSRFLRRLLFSPDVELQLRPQEVPLRLRNSKAAAAARLTAAGSATLRKGRARAGIRRRMRSLVGRHR